jgi:hypothetical protein
MSLDAPSELGFSRIRSKRSARIFGNPSVLLLRVFLAVVQYLLAVVQYLSLFFVSFIGKTNNQTARKLTLFPVAEATLRKTIARNRQKFKFKFVRYNRYGT